jgi:hypothetical protein
MSNIREMEKLPFPEDEVRSLIARVAARGFSHASVLTPEDVRVTISGDRSEVLAQLDGLDGGVGDALLKVTAPRSRPHRRWLIYAVPVASAAAAIALVAGFVLPPGKGGPSGAAAGQLDYLSNVAASQPTPALQPGQYYNQVWEEIAQMSQAFPAGIPQTSNPNVHWLAKAQLATWVDSSGTGRCTFTESGATFISSADQAAWESEGKPTLGYTGVMAEGENAIPPNLDTTSGSYFCPPNAATSAPQYAGGTWAESGAPLQLFDVSGLPTNPAPLGSLIAHRHTGIEAIDSEAPGEFTTFAAVVQLLSGPDIGATPAFRSALYRVLAGLPGVKVTDSVTDSNGRSGVEIALPTSYPSSIVTGSFVEQAIVDPATTDVLDWSVDLLGPSSLSPAFAGGPTNTYAPGTVYSFALLHAGIVDSNSTAATG